MNFSTKRKKKKMPNWCINTLEVQGKSEDLDRFMTKLKSVRKDELSLFQALIPMPSDYNTEPTAIFKDQSEWTENEKLCFEKYGHKDWYSWCNANWGVKWDISDVYWEDAKPVRAYDYELKEFVETGEKKITIEYQTPWAAGEEALEKAFSEDYPELSFHLYYEEPGMAFHGGLTVHKGEVIYNQSQELSTIHKSLEDSLEYNL